MSCTCPRSTLFYLFSIPVSCSIQDGNLNNPLSFFPLCSWIPICTCWSNLPVSEPPVFFSHNVPCQGWRQIGRPCLFWTSLKINKGRWAVQNKDQFYSGYNRIWYGFCTCSFRATNWVYAENAQLPFTLKGVCFHVYTAYLLLTYFFIVYSFRSSHHLQVAMDKWLAHQTPNHNIMG